MRFKTIAEIVGILGVVIAILQYYKVEPNALHKIPDIYKEVVEKDLDKAPVVINEEDYREQPEIYNLYRATLSMDKGYSRDIQIQKVIDLALGKNDFKIVIAAAFALDSDYTKSSTLEMIAKKALTTQEQAGYALIAAELIPSNYTKSSTLDEIIRYHEARANGKSYGKLKAIDKYKEVFQFADSSANMNMDESDAKKFTDDWLKAKTYEDFLYFKDVYQFADSSASMNMSAIDAETFARLWIDEYTIEEFQIFIKAFKFADSSAGMGMSEKEAELFAFNKIEEHRKETKANRVAGGI